MAIEPLHDRDITLSEADFRLFIPADLFENPVDTQVRRWGLADHVDTAISLAEECFGAHVKLEKSILEREEDAVVLIEAHTSGESEAVRQQYHQYVARAVERIPWPERSRISLVYYRE